MPNTLYSPFSSLTFDYEHCFLCGTILDNSNETEEHVFPKWLQNRHMLWNQRLQLINGTTIQYKQLTIPCCKNCNNEHLSNIENEIKSAIHSYQEFIKLDKWTIFKWITKIFYGLLFKDLSLTLDRRDPSKGTIINEETLARYRMIHEFLQSIRLDISFPEEVFSLFIFKTHLNPKNDSKEDFFFCDDIHRSQLAIQTGEVGIICCIGENGIIKERINDYLTPFYNHKIHPIQFGEIIGRIFHDRAMLRVPPMYFLINGQNHYEIMSNLSSFSGNYFEETKQRNIAYFIYYQLRRFGLKPEQIYYPSLDAVASFLTNHEGNLHLLDEYGQVIKDVKIKHDSYEGELYNPQVGKSGNL